MDYIPLSELASLKNASDAKVIAQIRELEEVVKKQAAERKAFVKAWEQNTPYRTYTPQEIGINPEVEGENRTCNKCSVCSQVDYKISAEDERGE